MTLWLLLAALAMLALVLLLVPLLRRRAAAAARADFDIEIYLDQLRELDRDAARGIIGPTDVNAARIEIEQRLLAADRSRSATADTQPVRRHGVLAVLLVIAVPATALALYAQLGSPGLPDQPFAKRPVAPNQELIARAGARIAEAEAAVRAAPDDARAWFTLGQLRMLAQQWTRSAEAFAAAARLDQARADYPAARGEALTFGADGMVTLPARRAFDAALARDPGEPRARYYLALAAQQAGNDAEALQAFAALWRDAPADARWRARLADRIRALAARLGEDADALLPPAVSSGPALSPEPSQTPGQIPGPNADDLTAAQQMSPDERNDMIRSMVERLETRLVETPDDIAGWRRLGQSWTVLGDPARASTAYGKALALAPSDPETLFRGAVAALDANDRSAALDRFTRLRTLIPPDSDAFQAVERAIREIEANEGG